MNRVLRKRLIRDFVKNIGRYMALLLLIVMGMYILISIIGSAQTVITGTEKKRAENKIEDGNFQVLQPFSEEQKDKIEQKGTELEELFNVDVTLADKSVLRIMKNRVKIDLIDLDEGNLAKKEDEIVVEKLYSSKHNISVGNEIEIAGKTFKVTGIGSVPDYDLPVKSYADMTQDTENFSVAFVSETAYKKIVGCKNVSAQNYTYAYRLKNGLTAKELKKSIDVMNLTSFMEAENNPRIASGAASDVEVKRSMGLVAGIILLILFTYVISVFVIHQIQTESSVIGALYALGAKKWNLIIHYLTLPTLIAFLGGVIGCLFGFSSFGVAYQLKESYEYYSIPVFENVYPAYLIIYGLLMPPLIAVLVNYFVINSHLSKTALSLIKNEQKKDKTKGVKLKGNSFMTTFQIRQILREARCAIAVVCGMFISMIVFMIGLNCQVLCEHVKEDNIADTKYENMYLLKYPEKNVPKGGEACFVKTLSKNYLDYNLDVTVIGIDEHNSYYDVNAVEGKSKVVISASTAQKYKLKKGDYLVLTDREEDMDYAFMVEDIANYSVGLTIFMDIDSMRELFEMEEDYYNMILADEKLTIDEERIYSITTRENMVDLAGVFTKQMHSLVVIMIGASVIIFITVMYLMMNVMVERASFGISLIKIFGYRMKEVRKLYLNGNLYIIAIGGALIIPVAKKVSDMLYPTFIANTAMGMDLSFSVYMYIFIYIGVILICLTINLFLTRKIKKILPAQVLKNRE